MSYISTQHVRDKEIKVRLNTFEDEDFQTELLLKKAKYGEKLSAAQYMRIIEKVFHKLPPEVTTPIFEQIIRENPNA